MSKYKFYLLLNFQFTLFHESKKLMKKIFQNFGFRHAQEHWHCGQSHTESKLEVMASISTEKTLFLYES